jgi:hypothetical protein
MGLVAHTIGLVVLVDGLVLEFASSELSKKDKLQSTEDNTHAMIMTMVLWLHAYFILTWNTI